LNTAQLSFLKAAIWSQEIAGFVDPAHCRLLFNRCGSRTMPLKLFQLKKYLFLARILDLGKLFILDVGNTASVMVS
jgi:hypothetical protein